jgi:hypothetical protein
MRFAAVDFLDFFSHIEVPEFSSQNSASLKFSEPEYETMAFSEESTLPLTKKLIKKSPERGAKI